MEIYFSELSMVQQKKQTFYFNENQKRNETKSMSLASHWQTKFPSLTIGQEIKLVIWLVRVIYRTHVKL